MLSVRSKFGTAFLAIAAVNVTAGAALYLSITAKRTDALVINLAGAQRMLSQKMAKEALVVNADRGAANPLTATLKSSVDRFDRVLAGLIHGDSGLGLQAADAPAIVERLGKVDALWRPYRANLLAIANGEPG